MNTPFSPQVMMALQKALKFHEAGDLDAARPLYEQVLKQQPKQFDALHLLGVLHHQQGQHHRAIELIQKAIALYGRNPLFHANLANALTELGEYAQALKSYDRALKLAPGHPEIELNRAAAWVDIGWTEKASAVIEQHLRANPQHHAAWFNLGQLKRRQHRLPQAIDAFTQALHLNGLDTQSMYELASTYHEMEQYDQALVTLDILLEIEPEHDKAWALRGLALYLYGRPELALQSLDRSGMNKEMLAQLLMVSLGSLQWGRYAELKADLSAWIGSGETVSIPFHLLPVQTSARQQQMALQRWVKLYRPPHPQPKAFTHHHQRIRLAYVSGDFKEHPVSYLTAELYELHDRGRFELIGVNINGKGVHDAMTERVSKAFDHYVVAKDLSDADLLKRLHELEVDIAIDLAGLTDHNRINLFAQRIAPVQINCLGFPGTLGASYIDYIIGDDTVIPPEFSQFYTEQVVSMPDTFQPNDRKRPIADSPATRAEVGLPEDAVVYCCFCNNYKYNPEMFDAWAAILLAVPGSVLWLLANNAFVEGRIQMEMAKRQFGADRLVFGGRLPQPQYLARYRLADLFLDTYPFNGGTTVSDALWAGLPVLTLAGETFASRMAASLLKAVGLPQMITSSHAEYQARAIQCGLNRDSLVGVKHVLRTQGHVLPLFDTPRYVRHLEQAYTIMVERVRRGEAPGPIRLT
ncbi:MAG: tetratricopeptide repeat protein [Alphaproteobacteria bacterium]|nr:tetratricopeptide repeat protein [Alphaproteobacteria bacterium]